MKLHMAAIWDVVAETVPDSPALVLGDRRRNWREFEDRAARLASAFAACSLGKDSKVGIYAYNSDSWVEAHYAAFKCRAIAANVNYRYTEHELLYLLDNADVEVLVFDAQFAERVAAVAPHLTKLRLLIEIDDGSGKHLPEAQRLDDVIAANDRLPAQDYSEDDLYMLYTGGTTGLPKGVLYRQGGFCRLLVGRALGKPPAADFSRQELVDVILRHRDAGTAPISIPAAPLMHGTGLTVGVVVPHYVGGCVVLFRNEHFDPHVVWRLVEQERVSELSIVGDAFAKPLVASLDEAAARGKSYDVSSLRFVNSAGVMFSHETKMALLKHADVTIRDMVGASEGALAFSLTSRQTPPGQTGRFVPNPSTKVFNERDEEVVPGSGEIGLVATAALVPVGYYKDSQKSAATFREVRGQMYSFPGDFARIDADGSLILLGRGSNCINTGGEKVFPEEVEEVVKTHPAVADCLVVGAPDDRFGQRVVAVVARCGELDDAEITAHVRKTLAGYKVPRQIVSVEAIARAPNGKADYAWARKVVAEVIEPGQIGAQRVA